MAISVLICFANISARCGTEAFALVAGEARMMGQFSASALLSNTRVLVTGGYGEGQGPQAGAWLYRH